MDMIGHNNPRVLSTLIDEKAATNFKLETQIKDLNTKFQLNNKLSVYCS